MISHLSRRLLQIYKEVHQGKFSPALGLERWFKRKKQRAIFKPNYIIKHTPKKRKAVPIYGAMIPPILAQTEAEPRPTFLITVGKTSTAYTKTFETNCYIEDREAIV